MNSHTHIIIIGELHTFFNFSMVVDSCLVFAVEDGCSSDSSWYVVVWLGDSLDL